MSTSESDSTDTTSYPLAWDKDGNPIDVPAGAVGWRVRRFKLGQNGGTPEMMYAQGVPLVLSISVGIDDLIDATPSLADEVK